ncbi:hypothetical protein SDC9_71090 [bioreactor metagenome]|uniref:Phosphatidic acid phosphatase type 2/haloperoxidase domain-containing protein n=1 Tax=bioreactor metagenome TaxID=1076179 RepID=A0A644Y8W4_9ZZZZ
MKITDLKILFWQPKTDWFKVLASKKYGRYSLLTLNYCLWLFLFYISYLLIKTDINIFWQLFFATIISEIIEKILKSKQFWPRPLHLRQNVLPKGILKGWYLKGSFPSGHAIKVFFFLVIILQSVISFPLLIFVLITTTLLFSRVILGLHYPIDIVGGIIIGLLIGFFVTQLHFPQLMLNFVQPIFNFIFLIK